MYLLIGGGFDMFKILGSFFIFILGSFGGYGGRVFCMGDVLCVFDYLYVENEFVFFYQLVMFKEWLIGVIFGFYCIEEFLQSEYLQQLIDIKWEVYFNSFRIGVRLIGFVFFWICEDGGEVGLYLLNIYDNVYVIGILDLMGDMFILFGSDGLSFGGFVCFVIIVLVEFWKIG